MCVYSNIGDFWKEKHWQSWPNPTSMPTPVEKIVVWPNQEVTKEDIEEVKKELQEIKKLLIAAKEYDRNTGHPDCEVDEKVRMFKEVTEALKEKFGIDVDLSEVFDK